MKKEILAILINLLAFICYGQTSHTKFFKDQDLNNEVSEKRARFSETITKNPDGTITTEVKDLNRDEIILKNGEPFGIWSEEKRQLNYNFKLVLC